MTNPPPPGSSTRQRSGVCLLLRALSGLYPFGWALTSETIFTGSPSGPHLGRRLRRSKRSCEQGALGLKSTGQGSHARPRPHQSRRVDRRDVDKAACFVIRDNLFLAERKGTSCSPL